ncbi:MAG: GrpB family protein [Candidatus Woesearchaeota archaeon]
MKVYQFRKYDPIYPSLYNRERKRIKRFLKEEHLIAHIGSTSVPKLSGKGVIDLMVAVKKKDFSKTKKKLLALGYEQRDSNDKNRLFFRRETKIKEKERRYHLHLTYWNNLQWKKANAFREYLIQNPKVAQEYELLKKKALVKCKGDGKKYRQLKNEFIKKITEKALKKNYTLSDLNLSKS